MKIAIYTIVKNESAQIDIWMQQCQFADYVCILDTGSTDNTIEKFKSYGSKVIIDQKIYENFRFDAARNDSMNLIPEDTEICICIDLDEFLSEGWRESLEKQWFEGTSLNATYDYETFNVKDGEITTSCFWQASKIHSCSKDWSWRYPIHESLVYKERDLITFSFKEKEIVHLENFKILHLKKLNKNRDFYKKLVKLRRSEFSDVMSSLYYLRDVCEDLEQVKSEKESIINSNTIPPIKAYACYVYGKKCLLERKESRALFSFKQALLFCPTYVSALFEIGQIYYFNKKINQAVYFLEKAESFMGKEISWIEEFSDTRGKVYELLFRIYNYIFNNKKKGEFYLKESIKNITNFNVKSELLALYNEEFK